MLCASTQLYHDVSFIEEVWAWYGLGTIALVARCAVRLHTVGRRGLQGDDYMSLAVLLFFSCDSVAITLTYYWATNIDYTEKEINTMTACQISRISLGSKLELVAWFTYPSLMWAVKGTMLSFLYRILHGLPQQRLVKFYAMLCGATYLAVLLTISLGCHPFYLNWTVRPIPPRKCTVKLQNLYVTTCLNVITDAVILTIPLPLLWHLKVSIWRKIALTLLLCSGIFVITAAILRIVFTLKANPSALVINLWGTRETIAGIMAVNAPILKPLFTRNFWRRGSRQSNKKPTLGPPVHRRPEVTSPLKSLVNRAILPQQCDTTVTLSGETEQSSHLKDAQAEDTPRYSYKKASALETETFQSIDSALFRSDHTDIEMGWIRNQTAVPATTGVPNPLLPEPALVWPPSRLCSNRAEILPSIDELGSNHDL